MHDVMCSEEKIEDLSCMVKTPYSELKAKQLAELFYKYCPDHNDKDNLGNGLTWLIQTFRARFALAQKRLNDDQQRSLILDLNHKWNAVRRRLHKKYGHFVIIEHGYLFDLKRNAPQVYDYHFPSEEEKFSEKHSRLKEKEAEAAARLARELPPKFSRK